MGALGLPEQVSSGDGTYSYGAGEKCHRSDRAWSSAVDALATRLEVVANIACSGARTDNVVTTAVRGELPQVEQLKQLAATQPLDVVLLTVGGNDPRVGTEVAKCFTQNPSCVSGIQRLERRSRDVAQRLSDTVIPAVQAASGATVVLVGYSRLLPRRRSQRRTRGLVPVREGCHPALSSRSAHAEPVRYRDGWLPR